jgi:hypothetical protein
MRVLAWSRRRRGDKRFPEGTPEVPACQAALQGLPEAGGRESLRGGRGNESAGRARFLRKDEAGADGRPVTGERTPPLEPYKASVAPVSRRAE